MSLVLSVPERLSLILKDCNPNVIEAYYLYQDTMDTDFERPSWIITSGEATYSVNSETSQGQAAVDESYDLFLVGWEFTGLDEDYGNFYEITTREIANDAVLYLLKSPNLQFANIRGLQDDALGPLQGVLWSRPQSRSAITLMNRDGIDNIFWGFSISLSIRSMMLGDEDEYIITT